MSLRSRHRKAMLFAASGLPSEGCPGTLQISNRSKRSIAIDLTNPKSRAIVDSLLDSADVVIHNFRPGVPATLGLDPETVRCERPSLIYVDIFGFGPTGPYADRPAYDHVIQALSGFTSAQADPKTKEPSLVRQGIVDKLTGLAAAQAVSAALVARARTGEGRVIHISMLDVAISTLWPDGMMNHTIEQPETVLPSIVNTFRLTKTLDGFIAITAVKVAQFQHLLDALGIEHGEDVSTPEGLMRHGGNYLRQAATTLSTCTTSQAVESLAAHGVPVAPVMSLGEVAEHPQIQANQTLDTFDHPVLGTVCQPNPGIRLDDKRARDLLPAPELGQHSDEILAQLGYSADTVSELRISGVLGYASAT